MKSMAQLLQLHGENEAQKGEGGDMTKWKNKMNTQKEQERKGEKWRQRRNNVEYKQKVKGRRVLKEGTTRSMKQEAFGASVPWWLM